MAVSKKKRNAILRNARKKPEALAEELHLSVEQVREVLREHRPAGAARGPKLRPDALAFGLLLALIALAPLANSNAVLDHAMLPKRVAVQTGILAVLVAWLAGHFINGACTLRRSVFYAPLAAILAWALARLLFASDVYGGLVIWFQWLAGALAFFLSRQMLRNAQRVEQTMAVLALSGALIGAIGVAQWNFGLDWFRQGNTPATTFANKNFSAQYLVLTLPYLFGLLIFWRGRAGMWVAAIGLALAAASLFYTTTRAAWLGAGTQAALLVALFLWERFSHHTFLRAPAYRWAAIACSLLLLLILFNRSQTGWQWAHERVFERLDESTEAFEEPEEELEREISFSESRVADDSIKLRLALWENSLALLFHKPLIGIGLDNFSVYYPLVNTETWADSWTSIHRKPNRSHNDPLQILGELGLVGAVILAALFFFLGKMAFGALRQKSGRRARLLAYLPLVSMAGCFVNANFSFPMYLPMPPFVLGIGLACFAALAEPRLGAKWKERRPLVLGRPVLFPALALSVLAFGLCFYFQVRLLKADFWVRKEIIAYRRKNYENTVKFGEEARKWNPWRLQIHEYLGEAYLLRNQLEQAEAHLAAYLEDFPYHLLTLRRLAACYLKMQDFARAEAPIRQGLELLPGEPHFLHMSGHVHRANDRPEEALVDFRAAAAAEPGNWQFQNDYAIEEYRARNYETALKAHRRVIELRPKDAMAWKGAGVILYAHLGRQEEGIAHFQKALLLKPDIQGHAEMRAAIDAWLAALKERRN